VNAVNRIIMLLLSAAALAFGIITLLLLSGAIRPRDVSPGGALANQWESIASTRGSVATTLAIIAVVVAVLGLILLILELLPRRREPRRYLVRRDGLGAVTVARRSVRDLVQYEAVRVPGVMEVEPEVRDRRNGLHIYARTSLAPEAEAATVGQLLQEKIQATVQRHIGLPVAQVQVATQIEPLSGQGRRVR
jgi:hypothetical protein